jgi:hypothetical protein
MSDWTSDLDTEEKFIENLLEIYFVEDVNEMGEKQVNKIDLRD